MTTLTTIMDLFTPDSRQNVDTTGSRPKASLASVALVAVVAAAIVGCSGDDTDTVTPEERGEVDREALKAGVTVTLADGLGTLTVPFSEPVPESSLEDEEDFRESLSNAVTLIVTSQVTGTTADLTSGTLLDEEAPDEIGEWNFLFNDDLDEATLTFFNVAEGDLTLKVGRAYQAALTIADNDHIESESAFIVPVTVVE